MTESEQTRIFANNLNYYVNKTGKLQKEIAKDLGISPQVFNNWCKGIAVPRMGKLQMLADYFGIPKSSLTDDKSEYEKMGAEDAMFLIKFHKLTPANQQVLRSTLDALLAAQEQ